MDIVRKTIVMNKKIRGMKLSVKCCENLDFVKNVPTFLPNGYTQLYRTSVLYNNCKSMAPIPLLKRNLLYSS